MFEENTLQSESVKPRPKRPWRPHVAGVSAVILGPVAGILIAWRNLITLGNPQKATQLLVYAVPLLFIELYLLFRLPEGPSRILGLAITFASYKLFTFPQEPDFRAWMERNPAANPRNGWTSLGWGLSGLVLAVVLALGVAAVMEGMGLIPSE